MSVAVSGLSSFLSASLISILIPNFLLFCLHLLFLPMSKLFALIFMSAISVSMLGLSTFPFTSTMFMTVSGLFASSSVFAISMAVLWLSALLLKFAICLYLYLSC